MHLYIYLKTSLNTNNLNLQRNRLIVYKVNNYFKPKCDFLNLTLRTTELHVVCIKAEIHFAVSIF